MDYPKISIITPSYNQAEYLETTIKSVISQSYPNLEYIIIDGYSTDGSIEIIKKYAGQLKYWVSEKDEGMYHALQKGFKASSGEIMGWINSDDILHNRSLFTIAEIFNIDKNINWITGVPTSIDQTNRIIDWANIRRWSRFNFFQEDCDTIQQESTYWKRDLWAKAGGCLNTHYKYAADLELWARFFLHTQLYSVKVPLGAFRLRPGKQLSSIFKEEYEKEADNILKQLPVNESDKKILKKIEAYNKFSLLLKSDSIRSRYDKLYNYPPFIYYDKGKGTFDKSI